MHAYFHASLNEIISTVCEEFIKQLASTELPATSHSNPDILYEDFAFSWAS